MIYVVTGFQEGASKFFKKASLRTWQLVTSPMQAVIGGFAAEEVMKVCHFRVMFVLFCLYLVLIVCDVEF